MASENMNKKIAITGLLSHTAQVRMVKITESPDGQRQKTSSNRDGNTFCNEHAGIDHP